MENQGTNEPPPPPPLARNHVSEKNDVTHTDIENQHETTSASLPETNTSTELERAHMQLVRAAWKGDWGTAEPIINKYQSILRQKLNSSQAMVLHIATGTKQTAFVEKLVKRMQKEDLRLRNEFGNTALCSAALTGNLEVAKILNEIDPELLQLRNRYHEAPLDLAIMYSHRDVVHYLFRVTNFDQWDTSQKMRLLLSAIFTGFLDIAMKLVEKYPGLAIERGNGEITALHQLARKPCVIGDGSIFSFFKGLFGNNTSSHGLAEILWHKVEGHFQTEKDLQRFIRHPTNLLHDAARVGNVELLTLMLSSYPGLILEFDEDGKSICHVALENRQEDVFNLIHEIGGLKHSFVNSLDKDGNNMLHLAAQRASAEHLNKVSGDALKMQREIMWYKEVEKMVIPSHLEMKNTSNQKPIDIFRDTHENLRRDGEKWMKDTTQNCMLVSTLIATVAFAAIFTIPGGNDQNTGTPIMRRETGFSVFVISDVSAMLSSSTSMFIFLSILTSRYAEEDFLTSLPIKLLFGLSTMFISILSMVLAFGATFFMLYDKSSTWVPWTALIIVFIPVTCFSILQRRLWAEVFYSTIWYKYLFDRNRRKPSKFLR